MGRKSKKITNLLRKQAAWLEERRTESSTTEEENISPSSASPNSATSSSSTNEVETSEPQTEDRMNSYFPRVPRLSDICNIPTTPRPPQPTTPARTKTAFENKLQFSADKSGPTTSTVTPSSSSTTPSRSAPLTSPSTPLTTPSTSSTPSSSSDSQKIIVELSVLVNFISSFRCPRVGCEAYVQCTDVPKKRKGFAAFIEVSCPICDEVVAATYTSSRAENKPDLDPQPQNRPFSVNESVVFASMR